MRLTLFLQRFSVLPNGNIRSGKVRVVREVKPQDLRRLREKFAIEEQNMYYLRHPYLTEEQTFGHSKAMNKQQKARQRFQDITRRIFLNDVTLGERLMHLRCNESWDD